MRLKNKTRKLKINSLRQLPIIFDTDPISKYYHAKQLDLFKITRYNKTSGKDIVYRCVVKSNNIQYGEEN